MAEEIAVRGSGPITSDNINVQEKEEHVAK
jgi:hypothetical protein